MKKIFISLLVCGTLLNSCLKDKNLAPCLASKDVVINFTTKAMSDITTRSAGSAAENAIIKLAVFGINEIGQVEQTFPVINNPMLTGNTLSILESVKTLKVIANPSADMTLEYSSLAELNAALLELENAPASPFVMGGETEVNSSVINVELVRSIAKIDVKGANGFNVASVAVLNTPSVGYVFAQSEIPSFATSQYTAYTEQNGSVVYVGENSKDTPTRLLVKGTYDGSLTAYTITLAQNSQLIDIVRNTAYEVTITPISNLECIVDVSIPEWNDIVADDNFIPNFGSYMIVDFHQHTGYTDGSNPIDFVLNQGLKYGVDIMVNSEHGGASGRNAGIGDTETLPPTWTESGVTNFKGTPNGSNMWRWQSIMDYSFYKVYDFNQRGTTTLAIQGLEWNPPGHEHSSSGVITGQFGANPNANAMAQFEYMFDASDNDQIGGAEFGWVKSTKSGKAKTEEAAEWLQANHRYTSWLVPAHPERQNAWNISDYRTLNDIAPDVFVAFESIPGHQASPNRGGIGNSSSYERSYTFGGVGIMAAKIGGLWDAMLSEGRRFWLVANSDFHNHVTKGSDDFYPGEYQKTYISMKDKTAQSFVNGLRSGNIYTVHGDLIDRLEFSVGNATMGQTFSTDKSSVKVRILVRDPETANNNTYTSLTNPVLDHIDLIAGEMRPKVAKGTPEYSVGTYSNVEVIARFDANGGVVDGNGLVSTKWIDLGGGLKLIEYNVNITGDTYFRLRGTNHGLDVAGKTDIYGNPTVDTPTANVMAAAQSAFEDLWFYSNPVFVREK